MYQLRTIDEVAAATGQDATRLRNWCATGVLRCERARDEWLIAADDVSRISQLAAGSSHRSNGHQPIGIAVPEERAGEALAELARRAELRPDQLSQTGLALDGMSYSIISWPSIGSEQNVDVVAQLADELGGDVLDARPPEPQRPGKTTARER